MKKNAKTIILVSSLALIATLAILFKAYYNDRYVETGIVYIKVPVGQSIELQDMKDMNGNVVDQGRDYVFEGYTEDGKSRVVEFSYYTEDPKELLQPEDYVRVSVSNTIVLNEKVVPEREVPKNVIELLNK